MLLLNLETMREDSIRYAKEYIFNKFDNSFAAIIQPGKKEEKEKEYLIFVDLYNNQKKIISNNRSIYKSLAFDEPGNQLTYLSTNDSSKIEQKIYELGYFHIGADSAIMLANSSAVGLPESWIFNEHSSPSFSKNGKRIILGAAPQQAAVDSTIVDSEMSQLDIWHWQDPLIQPQQLVELKKEKKRTYRGIVYPEEINRFIPIANEKMPYVTLSDEGCGRYALLWSNLDYQLESQWNIIPKYDVEVFDLEEKRVHEVARPLLARPMISPGGNYLYWWDYAKGDWFVYNNREGIFRNITENIPVNFMNEKNDQPRNPDAYGVAAWGADDSYIFLYDMFDIWKIDPDGKEDATNLTQTVGRNDSITFRYINIDPEKRAIEPDDLLLFSAFDNQTKERGYWTLDQTKADLLKKRVMKGYNFSALQKAVNSDLFLFQLSNFNRSPDLYVTNNMWKSYDRLTDINPQMGDYSWGSAELFSWNSFNDVPLQGILYKPEEFNPEKKYPVIIYFYEKHSDNLYSYFAPAPSRSIINIPFYVSRGYVVFTPDIHYGVGYPGRDAYNAVVSGAEALAKQSWVDADNMAIQGQSWGGYQVAYIITKTDMFKAAGAGAPVSNMTSAYGGIRWESGRSRQYQYEQTQSRLGATLNDSLHLYIANSPLFFANNVNTPLLIMHNDNDGAVPWYQGIEFFMSLRRLNKPVWMLQYNKEAHNLVQRRNCKDLSIRLQQFFDHYLKGEPAPYWMTHGIPAREKGKRWGYETDSPPQN